MQPSQPAESECFIGRSASRGVDLLSRQRTGILRFRTLQPGIRHYFWSTLFPNQNREWR